MTYKKRVLVLLTVTLGAAFNFVPASRAATIDQSDAPRVTLHNPHREAADGQAPRGQDTQSPRGGDPGVPRGGAET
jgi:uncharacterized protein YaiL (DUF2058 family)